MPSQLTTLTSRIDERRLALASRVGARDKVLEETQRRQREHALLLEEQSVAQRSLRVLQAAAEALRVRMKTKLEEIATKVLRYVFDDPRYEVRIDVDVKHNLVHARVLVGHDGVFAAVDEGHGGGVADVLAYVFRSATLRSRPDLAQILVCDEPFKFLNSQDAASRMAVLMNRLGESGVQQIVVSSKNDLAEAPGRHFVFSRTDDGVSVEVIDREDN